MHEKNTFITRLITFSLCFCLLFSSFPVHASGHIGNGGGINRTYEKPTGWKTWETHQKLSWWTIYGLGSLFSALGVIYNPSASTAVDLFDSYITLLHEGILANGTESWDDYINSHFQANAAETEVTVSSEFVNDFRTWLQGELDEESGYILLPTLSTSYLPASYFPDKRQYDSLKNRIDSSVDNSFCTYSMNVCSFYEGVNVVGIYDISNKVYKITYYDDNWSKISPIPFLSLNLDGSFTNTDISYSYVQVYGDGKFHSSGGFGQFGSIITSNGRKVKVFKSVEAMKSYSVGQQPYYCTSNYYNYNSSNDNSITTNENNYVSNDEYNNYYNEVSNTIINNNYNNGISEEQLAQIIDAIVNANNNNNGGSGGSSGGDSSGGSGILDMVEGVGKLLDFILSLVGKLVGLISDFLTNVLSMLGNFTAFTDGFGEFLTEAFGFLPPEAILSISLGVTVIVVLAIIKFLKG